MPACSYNELLELQLVLERAGAFFEDARSSAAAARDEHLDAPALGDREWLAIAPLSSAARPEPTRQRWHVACHARALAVPRMPRPECAPPPSLTHRRGTFL